MPGYLSAFQISTRTALQQLRSIGSSSFWIASMFSGQWSTVLNASVAGLPRCRIEVGGGRRCGKRNSRYWPANGMLYDRARAVPVRRDLSAAARPAW